MKKRELYQVMYQEAVNKLNRSRNRLIEFIMMQAPRYLIEIELDNYDTKIDELRRVEKLLKSLID